MEAIIYAHGAPPRMSALMALAAREKRQEFWQAYVADSLCIANRLWSGKEILPMYTQMVDEQQEKRDERTADDIIEGIKERMRKGQKG